MGSVGSSRATTERGLRLAISALLPNHCPRWYSAFGLFTPSVGMGGVIPNAKII